MMKYSPFFLCIFLFFQSCITINPNGYSDLTKTGQSRLRQFSVDSLNVSAINPDGSFSLTEVTGAEVKKVFQKEQFTWIYFWIPYCHGATCRPMNYYEKISNGYAPKGVRYIMLSQVYDSALIAKHIQLSGFNSPLYVIKDAQYGHNLKRNRDRFTSEIIKDRTISRQWPAHVVFKGDSLIYAGLDMSAAIMDSVLGRARVL
jgi:hypothetical protein